MKAEEVLERYKKTGHELTVEEVLEMEKEELSKLLLMMFEEDPEKGAELITEWALSYYGGYDLGESLKKSVPRGVIC